MNDLQWLQRWCRCTRGRSNAVCYKNALKATISKYGILHLASARGDTKRNLISQLEKGFLCKDKLSGRLNGSFPRMGPTRTRQIDIFDLSRSPMALKLCMCNEQECIYLQPRLVCGDCIYCRCCVSLKVILTWPNRPNNPCPHLSLIHI